MTPGETSDRFVHMPCLGQEIPVLEAIIASQRQVVPGDLQQPKGGSLTLIQVLTFNHIEKRLRSIFSFDANVSFNIIWLI